MYALVSLLLAAAPAQLTLDIKPADTLIFVDGKKVGDASKPRTVKLKPGRHDIKLTHSGDSHSDEVVLKPGDKTTWKFEFEEERKPKKPGDDEKADEKPEESPVAP